MRSTESTKLYKKQLESIQSNLNSQKMDGSFKDHHDFNIPDRSYGDLFCPLCQSHMNSDQMWQAHIIGKKHIKNLKRGKPEIKFETLHCKATIQLLFDEIDYAPVIGLKHIAEVEKGPSSIIYMCYLCNANVAVPKAIVDHVLDCKHKLACIKEYDIKRYDSIDLKNFSKSALETIINEVAGQLENELGRGKVIVLKETEKKSDEISCSRKDQQPLPKRMRSPSPKRIRSPLPKRIRSPLPRRIRSPLPKRIRRSSPEKRSDKKSRKKTLKVYDEEEKRKKVKPKHKEFFKKKYLYDNCGSTTESDEDYRRKSLQKSESNTKSSKMITHERHDEMPSTSKDMFERRSYEEAISEDISPKDAILKDILLSFPVTTVLNIFLMYLENINIPTLTKISDFINDLLSKKLLSKERETQLLTAQFSSLNQTNMNSIFQQLQSVHQNTMNGVGFQHATVYPSTPPINRNLFPPTLSVSSYQSPGVVQQRSSQVHQSADVFQMSRPLEKFLQLQFNRRMTSRDESIHGFSEQE